MPLGQLLFLGAFAGLTIFIGLPVGRLERVGARTSTFLSSIAAGVLLFLFWDVLTAAAEPVEASITAAEWSRVAVFVFLFLGCFAVGLLALVYYERWAGRRRTAPRVPDARGGPVLVATAEPSVAVGRASADQLAVLIALGIGLHNFAEGLAIGQSAAANQLTLAYALIIGFALHNATEGFGIVGPLAGAGRVPTWGFLAMLGAIGGGPTFLGTVVGQAWANDFVSVAFLTLAAGSIVFVIHELLTMARGAELKDVVAWGLVLGLFAGFATDWVLVAVGA